MVSFMDTPLSGSENVRLFILTSYSALIVFIAKLSSSRNNNLLAVDLLSLSVMKFVLDQN
jgi:hypothetical protein